MSIVAKRSPISAIAEHFLVETSQKTPCRSGKELLFNIHLINNLTVFSYLIFHYFILLSYYFWVTVSKTVRPMLSDHCVSVLSV